MSVPTPNCFIPLEQNEFTIGRLCIVCKEVFKLHGPGDPRTVCPDCSKAIKTIKDNSKSNWIPDSKGGEPNNRKK